MAREQVIKMVILLGSHAGKEVARATTQVELAR